MRIPAYVYHDWPVWPQVFCINTFQKNILHLIPKFDCITISYLQTCFPYICTSKIICLLHKQNLHAYFVWLFVCCGLYLHNFSMNSMYKFYPLIVFHVFGSLHVYFQYQNANSNSKKMVTRRICTRFCCCCFSTHRTATISRWSWTSSGAVTSTRSSPLRKASVSGERTMIQLACFHIRTWGHHTFVMQRWLIWEPYIV